MKWLTVFLFSIALPSLTFGQEFTGLYLDWKEGMSAFEVNNCPTNPVWIYHVSSDGSTESFESLDDKGVPLSAIQATFHQDKLIRVTETYLNPAIIAQIPVYNDYRESLPKTCIPIFENVRTGDETGEEAIEIAIPTQAGLVYSSQGSSRDLINASFIDSDRARTATIIFSEFLEFSITYEPFSESLHQNMIVTNSIELNTILGEYNHNEVRGDYLFLKKRLQFKGQIESIRRTDSGDPELYLVFPPEFNNMWMVKYISVALLKSEIAKARILEEGDEIFISATLAYYSDGSLSFEDGIFLAL